MSESFLRGHKIEFINSAWRYVDTKEPTVGNERPCGKCSKINTPEGHDGCLKILPNVMNVCCGHGDVKMAYVQFDSVNVLRGQVAVDWITLTNQ